MNVIIGMVDVITLAKIYTSHINVLVAQDILLVKIIIRVQVRL